MERREAGVAAGSKVGRRRFLVGGLAISAATLVACQNRLPVPPFVDTPATSQPRRPQPLADAPAPEAPAMRLDVDFGRAVRLEGVTIDRDGVRTGEYLRVWLYWLALDTSQEDLRALGRVIGPSGRVVGKEDDQIGRRKNYLSRWRPGDRQVDEMRIRIAPSVDEGEYALVMAVLRPDNQTHVPISSLAGAPLGTSAAQPAMWGEDAIIAGTIEVTPS